ncbi:hypothetical protein [Longimicrobium sp.]|uniref:hypothetical protein n=1 Tax=Longimicrobium sp. TaxID=2029185 RepID=UPI002D094C21|nr:hypothetical protein [Longimicrobium sp.]HSU12659.1 hypothetical protein [Longimicrobium sp.]
MSRAKARSSTDIRAGSRVVYHQPWGPIDAVVVEDRGMRGGFNARRIMRIRPIFDGIEDSMDEWEVPLEDLTLAE